MPSFLPPGEKNRTTPSLVCVPPRIQIVSSLSKSPSTRRFRTHSRVHTLPSNPLLKNCYSPFVSNECWVIEGVYITPKKRVSDQTNAFMEGLNRVFQATKRKTREYRNRV
jgi:hypothetical protein